MRTQKTELNKKRVAEILGKEALLKHIDGDGIIGVERIHQELTTMTNEDYLGLHKLKVNQGKDGRWFTNFVTETGERKTVRKNSREELDKAIIAFYKNSIERPTFMAVFDKWIAEKREYKEISESTYTRYMTHYNRFFHKNDVFCKTPLADMTDSILLHFIKEQIVKHQLTRKSFADLRILINGVFKYAKLEGYSNYSISTFFHDISLPSRLFAPVKVVKDEEDIFTISEAERLIPHLWSLGDIYSLGLILMFETGMRVGEITAIRRDCVSDSSILVCATEVAYNDPKTGKRIFEVQDATKTLAGTRTVYLPNNAKATLKAIRNLNPFGEFLLMEKGKRVRTKSMNYHLKKACKEIGIMPRSTHKIRKTYASTLLEKNVDERLVMQQLGHSDISTTQKYYYRNRNDTDISQSIINQVISF